MRTRNALLFGTAVRPLHGMASAMHSSNVHAWQIGGAAGKRGVGRRVDQQHQLTRIGGGRESITLPIESMKWLPVFFSLRCRNTVITTSAGNVVFDTGLVIQAAEQREKLQALVGLSAPKKIIVSHSHADHVGGVRFWDDGSAELVAHEEFLEEQRYLTELDPYLHQRNRVLFPWRAHPRHELPGADARRTGR